MDQTGLTGGVDLTGLETRSDRGQPWTSRRSEVKDTRRDRKACVEAKQGAVLGYPFDEENLRFLKLPLGACIDSTAL